MTWVVPLSLGGLAIAVMALFTMLGARRARHQQQAPMMTGGPSILVHDINDDRCTGCDACVAVCPTNVLDLVSNKSRVLRFHDCIQCEACMWACPTEALVMFPEGREPPPLKVPELDDSYQTAVPGQYLIGEVAGKPLVKNAANLGRGVIEHMLRTGLRPGALGGGPGAVDVLIVGSGPGGLSAALTCIQRGLTYALLEKEQQIASTIARYPKGKLVMAEPYETQNVSLLPVFDSSKEQIVPLWRELIERTGVQIKLGEAVETVQRLGDGTFDVRSTVSAYRAQRVILATGTRGKPRTLQVPGENLPKVSNLLDDPDDWRGKEVLVVGGGDSAVEAALALADAGARVIISYRGKAFNRAAPKNKQAIESYAAQQRLKTKLGSQVVAFEPEAMILQLGDGSQKRYANHGAFVLIGSDPPVTWLEKLGVRFVLRPHQYSLGKTDDFVRRMVPGVQPCPEDAALAAQAVTGRAQAPSAQSKDRLPSEVERALSAVSLPEAVSGPKKWIKAATGMFGSGPKKIEQPIPLSEFAKRQRTGASGRRDALSSGERTRVLRMLRDEGGRLADEESRLFAVDLAALRAGAHEDSGAYPAPRPPMQPQMMPGLPPQRMAANAGAYSPPMTLEAGLTPTFGSPATNPPPQGDIVAKPAVIVGLAKANAAGPRTRSGRADEIELGPGVRMKPGKAQRAAAPATAPPPPAPVVAAPPPSSEVGRSKRGSIAPRAPMFTEEPTRQVDPLEALYAMPERPTDRAPARGLRRAPDRDRVDRHEFRREDPTRASNVDPRLLAESADESTRAVQVDPLALFEEEATRAGDGYGYGSGSGQGYGQDSGIFAGEHATGSIDLGPRDQSRRFARLPEADESTRMGDLRDLVAHERDRARRSAAMPAAAPPPRGNVHDDATRTVDLGRQASMSDVDWDLD